MGRMPHSSLSLVSEAACLPSVFVPFGVQDAQLGFSFQAGRRQAGVGRPRGPVGTKSPFSRTLARIVPLITGQAASMFHFQHTY